MKRFKNPKAQELFDAADELEKIANKQLEENGGVLLDTIGEIFTEAAGMRVEADNLEEEYEEEMER